MSEGIYMQGGPGAREGVEEYVTECDSRGGDV